MPRLSSGIYTESSTILCSPTTSAITWDVRKIYFKFIVNPLISVSLRITINFRGIDVPDITLVTTWTISLNYRVSTVIIVFIPGYKWLSHITIGNPSTWSFFAYSILIYSWTISLFFWSLVGYCFSIIFCRVILTCIKLWLSAESGALQVGQNGARFKHSLQNECPQLVVTG